MNFVLLYGPNGVPMFVAAENVQCITAHPELIGMCILFANGGVQMQIQMPAEQVAERLATATGGKVVKFLAQIQTEGRKFD